VGEWVMRGERESWRLGGL